MQYHKDERLSHVGDIVTMHAENIPSNVAATDVDTELTYRDLDQRSNQVANALTEYGVEPGDVVGLYMSNSVHFLEAYFGVLKSGAVVMPMNTGRSVDGSQFVVDDVGAKAVIGSELLADKAVEIFNDPSPEILFVPDCSGGNIVDRNKAFEQGDTEFTRPSRSFEDTAMQLYTSGTTGTPKGVPLTNGNMLSAMESLSASGSFTFIDPDETILIALPLFHVGGLNNMTLTTLYNGGSVVIQQEFDPKQTLADIERYEVGHLGLVTPMLIDLNDHYEANREKYDISSTEVAHTGATPIPDDVRRSFVENWKLVMNEGWGMTETSGGGTYKPHQGSMKQAGCVGPPMYNIRIKIVDSVTGDIIVPADYLDPQHEISGTDIDFEDEEKTTGEIVIKGDCVFEQYYNLPEKTKEDFDEDGWFYTGDIARVDADGYLWMVDRKDDMILVGGENVYPAEVEEAIHEHPDVQETAVVAVPHRTKSEAPVAFVATIEGSDLSEDNIRRFTLDRVPTFAHPRRVFFIDNFPRSATEKIQRFKLEDRANELIDRELEPSEKL